MAGVIRLDRTKLNNVLRTDPRFRVYSHKIATRIKDAAVSVFVTSQIAHNEWRTSETTPPKYLASFRIEWLAATLSHRVHNDDPAWKLVEYGAHPGGDPDTFVLRYRPLGRGLDMVAGGN